MKSLCMLLILATVSLGQADAAPRASPAVTKTSLTAAIAALEQGTGAKVLEIRLADDKGRERFESVVAKGDEIMYLSVNTETEGFTKIEVKELPPWMLSWKMSDYVRSVEQAKIPLADAVSAAESFGNAPAIGAGLAKPLSGTNEVLAYNIELMKDRRRENIAIDATTGAKIANPEELYEPWSPVKLVRTS